MPAACVLFYSYADKFKQEYFINRIEDPAERARATDKLKKIVGFCESLTCRRKFLLEYFGEMHEAPTCGGCDCCVRPTEEFDADTIGRAVLECVLMIEGRFGGQYIVDILRGSRNERVLKYGHERLPSHGKGKSFSEGELKEIISALLGKGLLEKITGEYPVIDITKQGCSVLNGRERLMLPQLRRADIVKTQRLVPAVRPSFPVDGGLFEELRKLRKKMADAIRKPPYVIFGDVALEDMVRLQPQDDEAFRAVKGVGEMKLRSYGPPFMAKIREYREKHGNSHAVSF